jgi:hypothetical protein
MLRASIGRTAACCCLFGVIAGAAVASEPSPLQVVHVLGGEDDEDLLFHRPAYVDFADDGTTYVLNRGSSTILRLGAGWSVLGSFGAPGEGPGEFSEPTGMFVYGDRVWVVETTRLTLYALDGTYLETRAGSVQIQEPIVVEGQILARIGAGDQAAAIIDTSGNLVREIGPPCPEDFFASFRECGNLSLAPHHDGLCLMVNAFDGLAYIVGQDGEVASTVDLVRGEGESQTTSEEEDGETTVTMSMTLQAGIGCFYLDQYWLPIYPEDSDGAVLGIYDRDLQPVDTQASFPDDATPWRLIPTPRDELLLVSEMGSTIWVCKPSSAK